MKPAAFVYRAASSVAEAAQMLHEYGPDSKLISGGQSLVPTMNMRLARPQTLIDIGRIPSLKDVRVTDHHCCFGARVTQSQLEGMAWLREEVPLLAQAVPHIGHWAIRTRSTVGGSIAHADPSAEWPLVLTALAGEVTVTSVRGSRTIAAQDLFLSYFQTSLEPDEILTEVRLPRATPSTRYAFVEQARRHGDFALVALAAWARRSGDRVTDARLVFGGVGPVPTRTTACEEILKAGPVTADRIRSAARAAADELDPESDIHATGEYRKQLALVLAQQALAQVCDVEVR